MRKSKYLFEVLFLMLMGSACSSGTSGHVCSDVSLKPNLLQAPNLDVSCISPPVFNPILSENHYNALIQFNDLSYAVANEFGYGLGQRYPTDKEIGILVARIRSISDYLSELGFSKYKPIAGKTGRNNVDDDIPCILSTNVSQRLIVVTFHGSRSGDRNPTNHDGKGDWGSNYDMHPANPIELGILEMGDMIRIHRGYGNNLSSVRTALFRELESEIESLGSDSPVWVIFTGHSKGGGMASLGAGMVASYFQSNSAEFSHVKTAGVVFSSPKVYYSESSTDWFHEVVGRSNVLRINVHGDPVPINYMGREGYQSIGVLLLDYVWTVNMRNRKKYGQEINSYLSVSEWANFHYGSGGRGVGYEYDPAVVMPFSGLEAGFEEGRHHLDLKRNLR